MIRLTAPARRHLVRAIAVALSLVASALSVDCGLVGGPDGDCGQCIRAVECVEKCGGDVLQSGCCACPEGTFDNFSCAQDGGPDSGDASTD